MDAVTKMIRRAMNARFVGYDGAMTLSKAKKPTIAQRFGEELRKAATDKGLSKEAFIAEALKVFVDAHEKTAGRWWDGNTLPQTEKRDWFFQRFGILVPATRNAAVNITKSSPPSIDTKPTSSDLMAYAVGSLQTAIQSTDDQIVHDVKDSLKDPVQNPWMRIAVTLIRQAHRRD